MLSDAQIAQLDETRIPILPKSTTSFRTACQFALGPALLAWVLWRNWDPPGGLGLARMLSGPIRAMPLLLATVFYLLNPICVFVRWYCLVRAQPKFTSISSGCFATSP